MKNWKMQENVKRAYGDLYSAVDPDDANSDFKTLSTNHDPRNRETAKPRKHEDTKTRRADGSMARRFAA